MQKLTTKSTKDSENCGHEFLISHSVPIISEIFVSSMVGRRLTGPSSILDGDLRLRHRQKLLAHLLKARSHSFNLPLLSRDRCF